MEKINNIGVMKKVSRLLLRSIPFIPVPELFDILSEINKSNDSMNMKIENAYNSLRETTDLINDLENDLTNRTENITKLKTEYEKYANLAKIEESEAKALINQLESTFNKGKNKERVISIIISLGCGLIIFLLGIWVSPTITNFLTSLQQ